MPGHFTTFWKSQSTSTLSRQLAREAVEYIYFTQTESVKKWEMLVHKYADHSHHKHEESLLVVAGEKSVKNYTNMQVCVISVSYSKSTCHKNDMLTQELLDEADQLPFYHI
jgi:hemerythrin-like domain-containing protein